MKSLFEEIIKRHDLNFSVISQNNASFQISSLMESWDEYEVSYSYLDDFYNKFIEILQDSDLINNGLRDDLKKIRQVIDSHENKFQYVISVLRYLLINEFGVDQLNNFNKSKVNIFMDNSDCTMEYNLNFTSDSINITMDSENQITCQEFSNVIYIDSIRQWISS